jgi:hypothetical protein
LYRFDVIIVVDETAGKLKFHFTAAENDHQQLPSAARSFDVITTYKRHIVFNRLAASDNALQEAVKKCVEDYVNEFAHPMLNL